MEVATVVVAHLHGKDCAPLAATSKELWSMTERQRGHAALQWIAETRRVAKIAIELIFLRNPPAAVTRLLACYRFCECANEANALKLAMILREEIIELLEDLMCTEENQLLDLALEFLEHQVMPLG